MKRRALLALVTTCALLLAACGGASEETDDTAGTTASEPTGAMTQAAESEPAAAAGADVGTTDNPIQVLFVPSASADEIVTGGELLQETLESATGLTYEVSVPTSYGAVIEEMCASPTDTIGMIPAQAYVLANNQCGVEADLKAMRFGSTEYWAQFIVPRDSDAQALADLAGTTWAYPDPASTSGFLIPSGMLAAEDVEPEREVEAGSHDAAVQAVYDGTADFGTTYFTPASDTEGESLWDGDPANADVPDDLVDSCDVNADGDLACGDDYQVNDARAAIAESAPDVVQKVRIMTVSDPIPNDTVSFSPEFPEDVQDEIVEAITTFAENDPEGFATALDAYSWDGVAPASDADFDSIRAIVEDLGLSNQDLG